MNVIFLYGVFINLTGFILMGWDKSKAKRYQWRIPEQTLWFVTIIGGAFGLFCGMQLFHHKTTYRRFQIGVSSFIFLHITFLFYLVLS